MALDGGDDGLAVPAGWSPDAPAWLAPGGSLLFETSTRQAPAATDAVRRPGLAPVVVEDADRGATVVVGTRG